MTAAPPKLQVSGRGWGLDLPFRLGGVAGWVTAMVTIAAGLSQAVAITGIGIGAQALEDGPLPWNAGALFAVVLVVMIALMTLSQICGQRLVEQTVESATLRVASAILDSELDIVERRGDGLILDTIARNAAVLRRGAHASLGILAACAQLAGLFTALALVAPWISLLLLGVAIVGFLTQLRFRSSLQRLMRRAEAAETRFTIFARHLTLGFRELRGGRHRLADLIDNNLTPAKKEMEEVQSQIAWAGAKRAGFATAVALALTFAAAFIAPGLGLTIGVALAVFVASHSYEGLQAIITYLPATAEATDAMGHLDALALALRSGAVRTEDTAPAGFPPAAYDFRRIVFRDVCYRYDGPDAPELGPFDLVLQKGEVVFVTGGNGSGKSTLIKLLTGLYQPTEGTVLIDGASWHVQDQHKLFATVFTKFHLFDALPDSVDVDPVRVKALLQMVGLADLTYAPGSGIHAARLSAGRRKRLALVQALLEDRPILVLDEWTADQDPESCALFFGTILPVLKQEGRTVVAVTHDDRYFDRCDRLLRLVDGKILEVTDPGGTGAISQIAVA